jgi:hypothetical protein
MFGWCENDLDRKERERLQKKLGRRSGRPLQMIHYRWRISITARKIRSLRRGARIISYVGSLNGGAKETWQSYTVSQRQRSFFKNLSASMVILDRF